MHLAFLTPFESGDVGSWSGIPFHMSRAIEAHVDHLTVVPGLDLGPRLHRGGRKILARAQGHGLSTLHTAAVADRLAESASRAIREIRPDAVLCPSSLPFAGFEAECPVAFWTDATFESSLYLYADYSNLPDWNVEEGHRVERAALERADLAIYASDYAAASATGYYGTDPERVSVVPLGANLETPPPRGDALAAASGRPTTACTLLFLGVDWVRKGGDVAVLVADALNAMGVPTDLHVVGCTPTLDRPRSYVHVHGFVSKSTADGRATLDRLLREAHFLVMPVRAEAFGCVFCEASAFAVPSIATTSGGAGSAVTDDVNGFLYPPRPSPTAIAERIAETVRNEAAYRALAKRSRDEFETRLNWDTSTQIVAEKLRTLL